MVPSRGSAGCVDGFGEVRYDFIGVGDHQHLDNSVEAKMQVHTKVVVDFTSVDHEAVAVYGGKVLTEFGDLEGINMQDFEVVDVPCYDHLMTCDSCIGNAWVIWVDDERPDVLF